MVKVAMHQGSQKTNVTPAKEQQQGLQKMAYCPQARKLVVKNNSQTLFIPGGRATWWHCPACQGWHVHIET